MPRPEIMDIPSELLHEILLKLPTKDVASSCCVSRLWCSIVRDPSFRDLHAKANHVAAPLHRDVEALLVSVQEHSGCAEASVFRVSSSAKPMSWVTNPAGYRLTNVCNGLLCFASLTDGEAPVIIFNPVNGERLELPRAPPPETPDRSWRRRHYALGFSPSTKEYKLFRLSSTTNQDSSVHVHTLGDGDAGWRQYPHVLQHCPMYGLPPVLIDGKLYMVTNKHRVLVMDVASETYRTYRLPDHMEGLPVNVMVNAFELQGRLSVAVNILDWDWPQLQVWLLPPWDRLQATKDDDDMYWDRRYSFHLDAVNSPESDLFRGRGRLCSDSLQRAAWLDGDEVLCYRLGDRLYKYDTTRYMPASNFGFLSWNQKLQLWGPPSVSSEGFNFYGGYRPTLLSPAVFALTVPSQVEEGNEQEPENAIIVCVPKCHISKRYSSPVDGTDGRAAKRMCCSISDQPCRQGWTRAGSVQARPEPTKSSLPSGRA
jgi:F-box interacting protein